VALRCSRPGRGPDASPAEGVTRLVKYSVSVFRGRVRHPTYAPGEPLAVWPRQSAACHVMPLPSHQLMSASHAVLKVVCLCVIFVYVSVFFFPLLHQLFIITLQHPDYSLLTSDFSLSFSTIILGLTILEFIFRTIKLRK
jgi:hypothetical protein